MNSDKEWLFESLLTYNKNLDYIKEIPRTNGDYKNSPENSKYIEFKITPEFTEEEKSNISEIDSKFTHFLLIPYDLIVKMEKWQPEPNSELNYQSSKY